MGGKSRVKKSSQLSAEIISDYKNLYRFVPPCGRSREDEELSINSFPSGKELFVTDIQHLLLHTLFSRKYLWYPRFCRVLSPISIPSIILLNIDTVSLSDFENKQNDSFFSSFSIKESMISSKEYGTISEEELFQVSLQGFARRARLCLELGYSVDRDFTLDYLHQMLQKRKKQNQQQNQPEAKKSKLENATTTLTENKEFVISREELLLNAEQMIEMKFPQIDLVQNGEVFHSLEHYKPVTSDSPMFSMDCEMVLISGGEMALAKISVVDENGEVIYNELVKPTEQVVNYVTNISGITAELLDPVTHTVADVRRDLRSLLPSDAILVGHSLENDFRALKICHPYVIDTSVIYNLSGQRMRKPRLKLLASKFLKRDIQSGVKGHCSMEDAKAALDLVLLKMKNGLDFGDHCASIGNGKTNRNCDENDKKKEPNLDETNVLSDPINYIEAHKKFLLSLKQSLQLNLIDILHQSGKRALIIDSLIPHLKNGEKRAPIDWLSRHSFVLRPNDDKKAINEIVSGASLGANQFLYARLRGLEKKLKAKTKNDSSFQKNIDKLLKRLKSLLHRLTSNVMLVILLKDHVLVHVKSSLPSAEMTSNEVQISATTTTAAAKDSQLDLESCLM